MPDPIVVKVNAVPDPDRSDWLIVTVPNEFSTIYLSLEDLDQVQWICDVGSVEINFASSNNPFDPNQFSGGQYQTQPDGSFISGPLAAASVDGNPAVFRSFEYSILVRSFDGQRSGSVDPRIKGRGDRVYQKG